MNKMVPFGFAPLLDCAIIVRVFGFSGSSFLILKVLLTLAPIPIVAPCNACKAPLGWLVAACRKGETTGGGRVDKTPVLFCSSL